MQILCAAAAWKDTPEIVIAGDLYAEFQDTRPCGSNKDARQGGWERAVRKHRSDRQVPTLARMMARAKT